MLFVKKTSKILVAAASSRRTHEVNTIIGSVNTTRVREIIDEVIKGSKHFKEQLAACQHLVVDVHAEPARDELQPIEIGH